MKRAPSLCLATLLVAVLTALAFAITPAGTVITNQAVALVEGEVYYSNVAETTVLPVCFVSLKPDGTPAEPGQSANVTPGGTAYLAYRITNTGNDTFTYNLSLAQDNASAWVPVETAIYLDANGNAQVDPGEQQVQQVTLAAGASSSLVVEVRAPDQGTGDLFISLGASCPLGGAADTENYARVRLASGPALQVEKYMSPLRAKPGDLVHVSLAVRNVGDAPTGGEVYLSDDLAPLAGVRYEAGSAVAAKGVIEFFDGSAWSTSEPTTVAGLRLRLPGLDAGEQALLDFDVRVDEDAGPGTLQNRAVAEGPGGPAEAVASFEVVPLYRHFLGPRGNPRALPGGEGSADDRQEADLIADQTYCYGHTLENASTVADVYDLAASGVPAGVQATFAIGTEVPLSLPVRLEAGESLDFLFCVTASEAAPPFTADLVATSRASGEGNHTFDAVRHVYPAGLLSLTKSVEPQGTVSAGDELTYTLYLKNEYPIGLSNVLVEDVLDDHLEYLSSTPAGEYDAAHHRVRWRVAAVAPGGEWQATLRVRVKNTTSDDTRIENRFTLQADQVPNALVSDPVQTPVWSTQLLLQKLVNPPSARLGERLHYTLIVSNPSAAPLVATVTDTPDPHLSYVAGSGVPVEPQVQDGRLVWRDLTVEAGQEVRLEYEMRVGAGAPSELKNVAVARGVASSGAAVASTQATSVVLMAEDVFLARRATVVGRVFLDANENGLYDPDGDLPLAGARVLLADGRQAVTDAYGNYAFRDLEAGVWLVTLDPRTAPFTPLPHPEALADGYHHRVAAWGLTVSDFPLQAPAGVIRAVRKTSLVMGPFRVDKSVVPLDGNRYRVVLHLQSTEALPELTLRDPLPDGGEKTFEFAVFEGEKTITYELEGKAVLTDPEVRWRYP